MKGKPQDINYLFDIKQFYRIFFLNFPKLKKYYLKKKRSTKQMAERLILIIALSELRAKARFTGLSIQ